MKRYRIGVLATHPIQYHAPWFRHLSEKMDLEVFYAYYQDAAGQARAGFGVGFEWNLPLLEGYSYQWLKNIARHPGLESFNGCDAPEINEIIGNGNFDTFLVFGWNYKSAVQAILACRKNRIPVLLRGDSHLGTRRSWLKRVVKYFPYRWFLPRVDGHLYVGKRNREYLEFYGVPEEKLFFTPHFVDNDFFRERAQRAEAQGWHLEIRSQFGIPMGAFVFLFVGKMIPKKRPGDFIRACVKIFESEKNLNTHALLVGDGPLRTSLEKLAKPYSGRIHFCGFRNQTELPNFYKASNALILPSDDRETWGLVVNEAFACGIPAVVSDAVGCAPDLIEEESTGYTYPIGHLETLSVRMLKLRALCRTQPLVIQQALAKKIAVYSIEKATEGLQGALERILKKRISIPQRSDFRLGIRDEIAIHTVP